MTRVMFASWAFFRTLGADALTCRRDNWRAGHEERHRDGDEPGHLDVSIREVARSPEESGRERRLLLFWGQPAAPGGGRNSTALAESERQNRKFITSSKNRGSHAVVL